MWILAELTGILSGGAADRRRRPSSRFAACQTAQFDSRRKQRLLLSFWPKKNPANAGFDLARTGIEPATQGFSVLCSTN